MSNEEIFQTMKDLVSEQFGMELDEVTLETSFEDDLGADSVDLVSLLQAALSFWMDLSRCSSIIRAASSPFRSFTALKIKG